MTDLYIDGEWNGYGGDLISMALVCPDGRHFYEVIPCAEPIEWVQVHVMPVLEQWPIQREEFRARLTKFLSQFESVHIIADWPEDISYFCRMLITGPGERIDTPPLTMEVVRIDTVSKVPHNAFWDATALMEHMESSKDA